MGTRGSVGSDASFVFCFPPQDYKPIVAAGIRLCFSAMTIFTLRSLNFCLSSVVSGHMGLYPEVTFAFKLL